MDSSWNLSGHAATYTSHDQAWTNARPGTASLEKAYQYKNVDPYATSSTRVDATLRTGLESADNPWKTTETYYGT